MGMGATIGLPPKPAWGFVPNPSKELRSLHPFFASRRVKAAEQRIYARNPSPRTRPAGRLVRVVAPVPGCRVSLLVSMGVMGFLGDLGGEIEIFP